MKLKRIEKNQDPGYPSFTEHRMTRRSLIRNICGALALFVAGCKGAIRPTNPPAVRGDIVQPQPAYPPSDARPQILGEMIEPIPPQKPSGRVKPVEPPKDTDPRIEGKMVQPKPPKEEPPAIKGAMIRVTPPAKEKEK